MVMGKRARRELIARPRACSPTRRADTLEWMNVPAPTTTTTTTTTTTLDPPMPTHPCTQACLAFLALGRVGELAERSSKARTQARQANVMMTSSSSSSCAAVASATPVLVAAQAFIARQEYPQAKQLLQVRLVFIRPPNPPTHPPTHPGPGRRGIAAPARKGLRGSHGGGNPQAPRPRPLLPRPLLLFGGRLGPGTFTHPPTHPPTHPKPLLLHPPTHPTRLPIASS